MAVRIGKATGTSPESWLAMQMKMDLWQRSKGKRAGRTNVCHHNPYLLLYA